MVRHVQFSYPTVRGNRMSSQRSNRNTSIFRAHHSLCQWLFYLVIQLLTAISFLVWMQWKVLEPDPWNLVFHLQILCYIRFANRLDTKSDKLNNIIFSFTKTSLIRSNLPPNLSLDHWIHTFLRTEQRVQQSAFLLVGFLLDDCIYHLANHSIHLKLSLHLFLSVDNQQLFHKIYYQYQPMNHVFLFNENYLLILIWSTN